MSPRRVDNIDTRSRASAPQLLDDLRTRRIDTNLFHPRFSINTIIKKYKPLHTMILMVHQGDHMLYSILLRVFLCFLFLCACIGGGSCESAVVSEWRYGGSHEDWGYALTVDPDGTAVMAGMSYSEDGDISFQKGNGDLWIIAVHPDGTKRWERSYGGSNSEYALSIKSVSYGGYIVSGTTGSEDGDISGYNGDGDGWVLRLDANGEILWSLAIGGSDRDELGDIVENKDGTFTAVGYTFSNDGDISEQRGEGDAWVVRISAAGKLMSSMTYGGYFTDTASSVLQAEDGNLIIVGTTHSSRVSPTGPGEGDVWVFSLTPEGTLIWSKTYGGSNGDAGHVICEKDGKYYVAAVTNSIDGDVKQSHGASDIWILCLDKNGDLLFEKTYGGSFSDNAWDIKPMGDGLIIVGETNSVDGDITKNHGPPDTWVLFIDAEGTLLWEECIGDERYNSGQRVWPIDEKSAWIFSYGQRPAETSGFGDYVLTKIVLAENVRTNHSIPQASSSSNMVIPLPNQDAVPRDLDGDGLYEDLNGNGRADFSDITLFFEHLDWIAENEPVSLFDYNKNGRIDFGDVQVLQELIEKALE